MASSPALDRFVGRQPVLGPTLPQTHDELPFPATVNRLPDSERRLPDSRDGGISSLHWEHIAAGVLAGFGAGFAWAFALLAFAE